MPSSCDSDQAAHEYVTWSPGKPSKQLGTCLWYSELWSLSLVFLSPQGIFLAGVTAPGISDLVHFGPSQRPGGCQAAVWPPHLWCCHLRPAAGGFQICLLQAAEVRACPRVACACPMGPGDLFWYLQCPTSTLSLGNPTKYLPR